MKFIQTLVEVRARVIEKRARGLLNGAQKTMNRYIEEFDVKHDNQNHLETLDGKPYVVSKFKSIFTLWTPHYEIPAVENIEGEDFVRGKMSIYGWLLHGKMDISSLYHGEDDEVRQKLERRRKDPTKSKQFSLLVEATKGVISHLQHTANLSFVQFTNDDYASKILKAHEADPTEMLQKSVRPEDGGVLIQCDVYVYLKLPKK